MSQSRRAIPNEILERLRVVCVHELPDSIRNANPNSDALRHFAASAGVQPNQATTFLAFYMFECDLTIEYQSRAGPLAPDDGVPTVGTAIVALSTWLQDYNEDDITEVFSHIARFGHPPFRFIRHIMAVSPSTLSTNRPRGARN